MASKISVVVNTLNEEQQLKRLLPSIVWADEIIVCDMHSGDKTVEVAEKFGAKIFFHKKEEFVEKARNFAVLKATNDWVLVLDPDEQVPESLANRLQEMANSLKHISFVRIPRKNIIFGKWMKASMWWPDLNIRFFKKGQVEWSNRIHRPPETSGEGIDLPSDDKLAIMHHHYNSIQEFLERMMRYTEIQARELINDGYKFDWKDLIRKPLGEFLGRFFANRGFEDGLHGLALSFLQAFSFLAVYLKVWELGGFKTQEIKYSEYKFLGEQSAREFSYWFKYANLSGSAFKRFFQKLRNKF